jgi:uncharacterized phage infection (PIP) family protein YhgE
MTDTIRLTYRELAERLGIEPDSARIKARRLAKSGRWKLIPGNHPGAASTVEVPTADLVRGSAPERTPPDDPFQRGEGDPGRPGGDVQALEDHIKSLTARLEVADRQIDQLRADHAAELKRIRDELERARQDADRQDRLHREQRAEVEHLVKVLIERVEADQARLLEERDHLRDELQEARAEADQANANQVRLTAELEHGRQDADRQRTDHAAELERIETRLIEERAQLQDELQETRAEADHAEADQVRMARDVSVMFDELRAMADRHAEQHADRTRLQADVDRLTAELERVHRPWWRRLLGR